MNYHHHRTQPHFQNPVRTTNPCGEKADVPHFGVSSSSQDAPFETIAGPCTPLYNREKNVMEMPPECRQCIYDVMEENQGGVNRCHDICTPLICPDPWAQRDQTYVPTSQQWCGLAKCVEKVRQPQNRQRPRCGNPCQQLDRILFDGGKLTSKDYCE